MSWFTVGEEAAERMAAQQTQRRSSRNFFTRKGESARIRFLKPAAESFNYKRSFVKWSPGQKLLTSPDVEPNPFLEAGLTLQASFAWPILDKRHLEFKNNEGKEVKVDRRVLYFADGIKTRKQLIAFEKEVLNAENESRKEDGQEPLKLEDFNLMHYDIQVSKEQGAPWNFVAMKSKELTKEEKDFIDKHPIDLKVELKPLPLPEIKALVSKATIEEDDEEETAEYSYSADEEDVIKFS